MPASDTRITIGELWPLALPAGTRLLAGGAGLGQTVEWVASLRAAFPLFGSLSKGYLALARLDMARKLDSRITPGYLINELHRAQASGLVVDEALSAEDASVADDLALPVLLLPEGEDLHQVERDVLRTLVDREGQLARRETEAHQRLQSLLGHTGIQGVVDELARLTESDVTVKDKNSVLIASSLRTHARETSSEALFPIRVAGRTLGQLFLRAANTRRNPLDAMYARQAAEVCGIDILQRTTRQETEERLGTDLVELLLDQSQPDDIIVARLQRLSFHLADNRRYLVTALAVPAEGHPTKGDCQDVARDLQWAAQRDEAEVLSARYREHLLILCSFDSGLSERATRNWLREALGNPTTPRCSAGVSRIATDLPGLRQAISQALDAWELGRHIVGRSSPFYYEELGLYRLLAGLRARDEVKRFYDETLGALAQYDGAHGTELVHTLEVFFDENTNASQTSRALYVHRNTLNYRLQRIVEITGLDLNDAEARLAFQLALKLHRLAT
jgi:PucR family transcriptional regulator, purine catabolism regulatory protein